MRKKSTLVKISSVWCFWSRLDQFITNSTWIWYKLHSKPFFFKKSFFCIFNQKTVDWQTTFSKRPLNVCPLNCTYIGKNHLNVISTWSEIMSLKGDQLEILLSVYGYHKHCKAFLIKKIFWRHSKLSTLLIWKLFCNRPYQNLLSIVNSW